MTFLPIIERELRVRARGRGTYWARFAVALVGVLICLPQFLWSGPFNNPASLGRYIFNGVVGAAFVLSCAACLLTADAITVEKREGTLGLLFLTRVKSVDVLLGKLGSIGITSMCGLVAFLPVLMIPVLAGGVTGGEAARKGLALLNTLFFALAAGLFQSASKRERFKAVRGSILLVLGMVVLPLILGLFGNWGLPTPPAVVLLSPLGALICADDVVYQSSSGLYSYGHWSGTVSYWASLACVQALAWLLLIGAGVRLRRAIREEGGAILSSEPLRQTNVKLRSPRWQQSADHASPIEWLVRRQRGVKAALWMAALAGLVYHLGWTAFGPFVSRPFFSSPFYFMMQVSGLAFSVINGALFAWAASRFLVEARRTGELELLLTTPLGAKTIVSGQWNVLLRLLRWPVLVMLLPFWLRVVTMPFMSFHPSLELLLPYAVMILAGVVNTILAVGAVCWLGLWFGLKARGQAAAIVWTVALTKGVPFLIYIPVWSLVSVLTAQLSGNPRSVYYGVVSLLPQIAIFFFYVWLIRGAKRRLLHRLTEAEPMSFNLRQWFSDAKKESAAAIRRARHWTPP